MNKINYSYIQYPDGSYGRVQGRRNQAYELASRLTGKAISEVSQVEVGQASVIVIIGEVKRITCNNYRKMHGLPMYRKARK